MPGPDQLDTLLRVHGGEVLGRNYVFVRLARMNVAGHIDYSETSRILEAIRRKPIGTRFGWPPRSATHRLPPPPVMPAPPCQQAMVSCEHRCAPIGPPSSQLRPRSPKRTADPSTSTPQVPIGSSRPPSASRPRSMETCFRVPTSAARY